MSADNGTAPEAPAEAPTPQVPTNDPISNRDDAGGDKYASSVFMPTDLRNGINRIIRVYGLDIKQTIGVGRGVDSDIWADERDLIGQIAEIELNEQDQATFENFKALVAEQEAHFAQNGTYFVFVDEENPQRTSYFLNNGFDEREDY